ncbi:MAG: hormogonium polysaccharide biosynthesis glycosyltransferase HpsN, partial [Chroococcales cyanobacterium]
SYQVTFYHNHFLLGLNNLTLSQCLRFFARLFDCHVLGHPPCNKSGSPIKTLVRFWFYTLGFFNAVGTVLQSNFQNGQIYSQQDELALSQKN